MAANAPPDIPPAGVSIADMASDPGIVEVVAGTETPFFLNPPSTPPQPGFTGPGSGCPGAGRGCPLPIGPDCVTLGLVFVAGSVLLPLICANVFAKEDVDDEAVVELNTKPG